MNTQSEFQIAPFVSVIIPTHTGRRECVRKAIESLFHQSYPKDRYEIIIVDNASTDGTEEMMKFLQTESPCDLKYLRNKEDIGCGISRQMGLEVSRGEIIASMDSDCIASPEWLSTGIRRFTNDIGLIQGKTLPFPDQPRKFWSRTVYVGEEHFTYGTCNMFYKKMALLTSGGFQVYHGYPKYLLGYTLGGEDLEAAWRMKRKGWQSIFAEDAIVYHQVFDRSLLKWLLQPACLFVLPDFVKRYPEIKEFLYLRVFLDKGTAFFGLSLIGIICGIVIHPVFFVATFPYVSIRLRQIFKYRRFRRYGHGLTRFALQFLYDCIILGALVYGSIRYRAIVI